MDRMQNWILAFSLSCVFIALAGLVASAQDDSGRKAMLLTIDGGIGPATADYIIRGIEKAEEQRAEVVLLVMDTPGGLVASTRDIIKAILGSSVPVVTYVSPSGSRAASAGTYILYASHVAAMAPATNVGSATPVQAGGPPPEPDKDKNNDQIIPAYAGAAIGEVIPGTTSHGNPASSKASASSPPRPKTNGSPPLRRHCLMGLESAPSTSSRGRRHRLLYTR